ncbi:DUF4136 domain-containing protein [Emcibacter sp.]|uniref:DUF4136 domain-containing protein n=1 Tax=Emcibacter sp. TaxID=1979954 RepID=UPI002AA63E98|nr:DUF4136 domain-containing protein [Emcibacter sp.]
MKQTVRFLFLMIATATLAACSGGYKSDVTRFHNLPRPAGESIEVMAARADRQSSLEFGQYAELIGARLGTVGYTPPIAGQGTPLIAYVDYGLQPVAGVTYEEGSSASIGMGTGGRHTSFGLGLSFPIGESKPRQEYVYILSLDIVRRGDGVKLYEGKSTIRATGKTLNEMMPLLADALFADFPGQSGTATRVKVGN